MFRIGDWNNQAGISGAVLLWLLFFYVIGVKEVVDQSVGANCNGKINVLSNINNDKSFNWNVIKLFSWVFYLM